MVCIVDDDPAVREALRRLMDSAGFKSEVFASAEEFLEAYGGEEFCIELPEAPRVAACARAEELRKACPETSFEFDGVHIRISISAGVAESRAGGSALDILKRADERLYEAKRAGRNRVY